MQQTAHIYSYGLVCSTKEKGMKKGMQRVGDRYPRRTIMWSGSAPATCPLQLHVLMEGHRLLTPLFPQKGVHPPSLFICKRMHERDSQVAQTHTVHTHTGRTHAGHSHTGHTHAGHSHTGHSQTGHTHTVHMHTGCTHTGHTHTRRTHVGHPHRAPVHRASLSSV